MMNGAPLGEHTVAVIDDSRSTCLYLEKKLSMQGFQVYSYMSGTEAIKGLDTIKPDIILLDINMPGMDGYQVCSHLKGEHPLKEVPILFISAMDQSVDKVRGFSLGAVDYVTKPIIFEELQARINTHIKLYKLQKEQLERNQNLEELVNEKMKEVYTSQMCTILALAKLAESRDPETGSHLERVQRYCTVLAKELSTLPKYSEIINDWYIEHIEYASALHDIGKVAIADAVLLKPGKLTFEEFEEMKKHSQFGSETLKVVLQQYPQNEFIQMGIDIALYHHEKWNGKGYPKELQGEDIPLCARIMAVADVYDALRSERCYKKGFSHAKAYGIIEGDSGTHFDPEVVEAFIKHEEQFNQIWHTYSEKE